MDKPEKHTPEPVYDFHACTAYLEERDRFDHRDVAGKYSSGDLSRPHQDFWHFCLDRDAEIRNGGTFVMAEWWGQGAEPWQQTLLRRYLDTFGETDPATGERFIAFTVAW